jgi:hypothetical protein
MRGEIRGKVMERLALISFSPIVLAVTVNKNIHSLTAALTINLTPTLTLTSVNTAGGKTHYYLIYLVV